MIRPYNFKRDFTGIFTKKTQFSHHVIDFYPFSLELMLFLTFSWIVHPFIDFDPFLTGINVNFRQFPVFFNVYVELLRWI
jgi:hypothetical protein